MPIREYSVKRVAQLLRDQKASGESACLLVGAGVSKSAGIGLATDFIDEIRKRFSESHDAACAAAKRPGAPTYGECMFELTEKQRTDLVRRHIEEARINWAHVGIALLEEHGYVDRILTTNFDPLAARACALFNRFPAIYDLAALRDDQSKRLQFKPGFVSGSAIYHLHGQHTGFLLLNTDKKLGEQAERVMPVIREAIESRPLIVCGYSGVSDPLIERIAELGFPHGLIWVCFDAKDPDPAVCAILERLDDCFIVRNKPADRFFVELYQALEVPPPAILMQPFAHLSRVFDTLRPYSDVGDGNPDLVDLARQRLQRAQDAEAPPASVGGAEALAGLFAEGKYEELLVRARAIPSLDDEGRDLAAWAAIMLGVAAAEAGRTGSNEVAPRHFGKAGEHYAEALAIKPDRHEALNNWGNALFEQARRGSGEPAQRLFAEAGRKYAAALAIKPDFDQALYNLGNAIFEQAKLSGKEVAPRLLAEAEGHYSAALAINPDHHEALNNWGNALLEQAERSDEEAAQPLLAEACRKYAAALAIKPDQHQALSNWCVALSAQARFGGRRDPAIVAEAEQKALAAEELRPGFAAYNLACLAGIRGDARDAARWLRASFAGDNFPGCDHLLADGDFAGIRDDPAFRAVLAEIGCAPPAA